MKQLTAVRPPYRRVMTAVVVAALTLTATGAQRIYPSAQPLFQAGVCPARQLPPPDLPPIQRVAKTIVEIPATRAGMQVIATACASGWQPAKLDATTPLWKLRVAALRDLRTLTPQLESNPAQSLSLAGYEPRWRYQWPRDAAMVAVAFARNHELERATAIFRSLQSVQRADGTFAPRVNAAGMPPDDRPLQFEATGWYVWGFGQLLAAAEDEQTNTATSAHMRQALWEEFSASIHRSGEALLAATEAGLPAASSDYWEREETKLTLATAALTLAGLEAIAALSDQLAAPSAEDLRLSSRAATRAAQLKRDISASFGPDFGRYGANTPPDAAIAFLLPPFQPQALPGARAAWRDSLAAQYVPASGGYAPGAGWKDDGISWTPETTLHALVAANWYASGEPGAAQAGRTARDILTWLSAHTTVIGAIPEKIAPGGVPSAVAPLAWSAANVVLTIKLLGEH